MLKWFRALMPREDRFFDLFEQHSLVLVAGAEALQELLKGGENVVHYRGKVIRHEEEADVITREVMLAVRRSFITPFDRSDITRPDPVDGRCHRPDAQDGEDDHPLRTDEL